MNGYSSAGGPPGPVMEAFEVLPPIIYPPGVDPVAERRKAQAAGGSPAGQVAPQRQPVMNAPQFSAGSPAVPVPIQGFPTPSANSGRSGESQSFVYQDRGQQNPNLQAVITPGNTSRQGQIVVTGASGSSARDRGPVTVTGAPGSQVSTQARTPNTFVQNFGKPATEVGPNVQNLQVNAREAVQITSPNGQPHPSTVSQNGAIVGIPQQQGFLLSVPPGSGGVVLVPSGVALALEKTFASRVPFPPKFLPILTGALRHAVPEHFVHSGMTSIAIRMTYQDMSDLVVGLKSAKGTLIGGPRGATFHAEIQRAIRREPPAAMTADEQADLDVVIAQLQAKAQPSPSSVDTLSGFPLDADETQDEIPAVTLDQSDKIFQLAGPSVPGL